MAFRFQVIIRKTQKTKSCNALHQILIVIWNKEQICFLNLLVSAMANSPNVTEGRPSQKSEKNNNRPSWDHWESIALGRKIFTTLSCYCISCFLSLDDLQNQLIILITKYPTPPPNNYTMTCFKLCEFLKVFPPLHTPNLHQPWDMSRAQQPRGNMAPFWGISPV